MKNKDSISVTSPGKEGKMNPSAGIKATFVSLCAVVALVLTVLGFSGSSASANETQVSYSVGVATATSVVTAVASSDVKGKVNLEYISKTGYTGKGKCKKVAKPTLRGDAKCIILPVGTPFTNSGRDRAGKVRYYQDKVKAGASQQTFWWDAKRNTWRKQNCGNMVRFGKKVSLKASQVHLVKSFSAIKVTVSVTATAPAKATATASCSTATSSASATATASATGTATATAMASARTKFKARAAATAQVEESVKVSAVADAKAKAAASAIAEAEAEAQCASSTPAPTPTVTPTPTPTATSTPVNQPPTGEVVQFPAHLYPGGEYRAKVVGSDPEDLGNVTLDYTVTGGATKIVDANHPEICDVENTQKVCYFWIKAGQTSGVNATLTLTVKDSKGLTFTTSKSWPIVADEF